MAAQRRKKIAILGGGVGAMTAAFELTAQKDWQEHYEVTVYQMGWRLGGKGASGRNHEAQERIEEHGLHILLGFYDNAFNVLKRCYDELGRPAGAPLATWRDAFKPHNLVVFSERIGSEWQEWPIEFPVDDEEPGGRDVALRVWEYVPLLLGWMSDMLVAPTGARRPHRNPGMPWARCIRRLLVDVEGVALTAAAGWLWAAEWLARSLDADPRKHRREAHHTLVWLLDKFIRWLWDRMEHVVDRDAEARHLFMALDLSAAIITGLIVDGVIFRGFDAIDDLELHEWLEKHGASKRLTLDGSWTRAAYNLPFAYRYGDTRRPCAAAGTALRGVLRMVLTYKGAIMWKMQAGMGDTIFGPLYEVLKRRGVRFEFFHRVKHLHPAADGRTIERISLGRQVRLKKARSRKTKRNDLHYDPLIPVKDLPCWPSEPLYDQLEEGEKLRRLKRAGHFVDLESYWTTWKDVEEITLMHEKDFDLIVLGISLGALPLICKEVIAMKPAWRHMVRHVETIRTMGVQIWLRPSLEALGWPTPSPVLGGYVQPFDTWADMTHLIDREKWPAKHPPGNLAYFCGPLEDGIEPPYFTHPEFQQKEDDALKKAFRGFLERHTRALWPHAVKPGEQGLNWDLLVDPQDREGAARLDAQYFRANLDPSERYVLSVPGSTKHRLRSDESGFHNLFLAGDWTRNGLNAGCVEAAVMSGMQASRAICGQPEVIVGESDV